MRRLIRRIDALFGNAWRAAPLLATTCVLVALGSSLLMLGYPLGFRYIVDGAAEHQPGRIVIGLVVVAVTFPGGWALQLTGATLNATLTDLANLRVGMRIGALASQAPFLEHFERPDYLAEIDNLRERRRTLAGAPVQTLGMLTSAIQFIGIAVPDFLLALLLLVFASNTLHMDVGGLFSTQYANAPWSGGKIGDLARHIWIPVIVIGASSTAWLTRVMRANLLDVLNQQYVQTARAKGLRENIVIWKHAVRNALHPLIMALGGSLPGLISGETIVSIVLNLPTTGPLYFSSLVNKDMYLAITFLVFLAIMLIVGYLLADLLLAWVDPRVRLE